MSLETIDLLKNKKVELINERDQYNFDLESREIETLNEKLNSVIQKRNSKQQIFDSYQKQINKIDTTIENIEEFTKTKEKEDEEYEY